MNSESVAIVSNVLISFSSLVLEYKGLTFDTFLVILMILVSQYKDCLYVKDFWMFYGIYIPLHLT